MFQALRPDKTGQGVHGSQALIPRGYGALARGFELSEEATNHGWGALFDRETIDGGALLGGDKGQQ